jgi:hypothetical protein
LFPGSSSSSSTSLASATIQDASDSSLQTQLSQSMGVLAHPIIYSRARIYHPLIEEDDYGYPKANSPVDGILGQLPYAPPTTSHRLMRSSESNSSLLENSQPTHLDNMGFSMITSASSSPAPTIKTTNSRSSSPKTEETRMELSEMVIGKGFH